jgi:hypothetical protein
MKHAQANFAAGGRNESKEGALDLKSCSSSFSYRIPSRQDEWPGDDVRSIAGFEEEPVD